LKSGDDKSIIAQRRLQGDALERAAAGLVSEWQGRNHRPRLLKIILREQPQQSATVCRPTLDLEFEIGKKIPTMLKATRVRNIALTEGQKRGDWRTGRLAARILKTE
jgi:hypothetical protein